MPPPLLDPATHQDLIGRLYNYKFASAATYLTGAVPPHVAAIVRALASNFGNADWAPSAHENGIYGLVGAVVDLLTGGDDEVDDDGPFPVTVLGSGLIAPPASTPPISAP